MTIGISLGGGKRQDDSPPLSATMSYAHRLQNTDCVQPKPKLPKFEGSAKTKKLAELIPDL